MKTKAIYSISLCLLGLSLLGACSNKKFSATSDSVFQQCVDVRPEVKCAVDCTDGSCVDRFDYTINTDSQVTDILFVVDNSGSMYNEQAEMGSKFPSFLNSLSGLNYRIGITTTDISGEDNPADIMNGYGAFQDGRLLSFPNGQAYLDGTNSLITEQDYFDEVIKRDETLTCEANGFRNPQFCPSGDERGILAAAMTLENNPSGFVRPVGHMAIVFLTDEDEGSDGDLINAIESPENFVNAFRIKYPNKSLAAHSIIIQPANTTIGQECYAEQASGDGPRGQYGEVYAELTQLTEGILGNICEDNFSYQLSSIGQAVATKREVLPCRPINDEVEISYNPEPIGQVQVTKNFAQNEILFESGLAAGTEIRLQFTCAK